GDAVAGARDVRGGELLLDDELLDRAGVTAPRLGPVGHHVPRVDHRGALRARVETLHLGDGLADGVANLIRLLRQVERPVPSPAPSQTAPLPSSASTSMLAQWCFTAWYVPIGRPNWMRTLAYPAASSQHSRATPVASAARIVRARSTRTCLAPGTTSAGAPS